MSTDVPPPDDLAAAVPDVSLWPRTIQANIGRFYQRIIAPVLYSTPVHEDISTGVTLDMNAFLEGAKAQVDNYTANEANKVYALVLISLFERYLRLWGAVVMADTELDAKHGDLFTLLTAVSAKVEIKLEECDLLPTLQEALLVGNAVRHGEGRSMDKIRKAASHLIDRSKRQYVDLIAQETPDSEWLRIRQNDIERYVRAMIRFWGLADKHPMAVTSMPLGGR